MVSMVERNTREDVEYGVSVGGGFVNAFWDELSPIESDNSNFIAYRSPRFHLQLSKYFHNNMIIFFDK